MHDTKTLNLDDPSLFLNRELSQLAFIQRVLAQARDPAVPLLERLVFLCISCSNLDEFFEIRVANLKRVLALGSSVRGADGSTPSEQLGMIAARAQRLIQEQYALLNEQLFPDLGREGIHFLRRHAWTQKQSKWIKSYFNREMLPLMSPLSLDPAHPFPQVLNKSLNFMVSLEGKDAFGRNTGLAVVQAPRSLPRLVRLPASCASHPHDFVFLSSIIHRHVADLFPGMKVTGCYQFRVTRNADLDLQEEETEDLLRALEGQLSSRRFGEAVRLEVADNCPREMSDFLRHKFQLQEADLYQVNGPVNLHRLIALPALVQRPDLRYPPFTPGLPRRLLHAGGDIFEVMRKRDVLLHHPFQSFQPVIDFLRQAASDPDVLAIKQTLYRTGDDSSLVEALVAAAQAGKEVTVVIELMARFDEEENIELASELQAAGAHVSYGVVGHKTHAKMILVIRREGRKLKRYVHLGTGNYHAGTARQYSDYGLFTCDQALTDDVQKVFQQLTAMGRAGKLKKILQAPFTLHKGILDLIAREAAHARAGRPARIIAKMNSLVEPTVIRALYEASRAGVKIELIVRGMCSLRPGVKGVSDNISVRSIIGRFLEHTRVCYFHNGGDYELYCSSADWRERNFFRRIELCFPIEDVHMKKRVLKQGLQTYLADNSQAWLLQTDGEWKRAQAGGATPRSAQQHLLGRLAR